MYIVLNTKYVIIVFILGYQMKNCFKIIYNCTILIIMVNLSKTIKNNYLKLRKRFIHIRII